MTVYSGPVFDVAVNPFAVTSDHLAVPLDQRDRAAMNTTGLLP
jgi:glutamate dehydrogenase (NAD(P)+)